MKPIILAIVLLLTRAAASADAEPAKKKAHPPVPRASSEKLAPPATVAEPGAGTPQTKWALPELPPPDKTEVLVGMPHAASPTQKVAAAPASTSKTPAPAAATANVAPRTLLASMRAVSLAEGEARVSVAQGERVLRPGDRLGADTVRSVSDGVIVLDRPAAPGKPGGAATVVVRFDANGQARVRVLYEHDPTPLQAPRVH